jgi:predicted nucleic acid binding AN1-type Zn finger protein
MDLEVGARCSLPNCGLRDFLPFPCPLCHAVHCTDHNAPDAHGCAGLASGNARLGDSNKIPLIESHFGFFF